ncbi:MAG: porin family protein [Magnetospirillum sp. WYHS-4]
MKIKNLLLATVAAIALTVPALAAEDQGVFQLAEAKPAKANGKTPPKADAKPKAEPAKKAYKTATVSRVRIGTHPDKTRLVLDMSGPVHYGHSAAADNQTTTVDLENVKWTAPASAGGGKSEIASYGFTPANGNGNGKLDIKTKSPMKVQKIFIVCPDEGEGEGRKLVVDLVPANGMAKAPAAAQAPAAEPAKLAEPAPAAAPAPEPQPTGLGGVMAPLPEPTKAAGEPATGTGAYLRLDAGLAITHDPELSPNNAWPTGRGTQAESDSGDSFAGQVGIGYRFSPEFRSDITLGLHNQTVEYGSPGGGSTVKGETDIRSLVTMLNAYYDIGTFDGLTPYLGAGIGWAHHWSEDINHTSTAGRSGSEKGDDSNTFAWGVGGGVAYALSPEWVVDLSYRFTDLGKPDVAKGWTDSAGTAYGATTLGDHLRSHDIMIGLRYQF